MPGSRGEHKLWRRTLVLVAGVTWLAAGCSSVPYQEISAVEAIDEAAAPPREAPGPETAQPVEPPPEVTAALLPPLAAPAPADGERFDVAVAGAPAEAFFMGLVEGTPQNMVVHPDVTGTIHLTLKDVTLLEVLETVRDVYGYDFRRTRSGFMILPPRMQSRIFYVSYLDVVRSGQSRTRVSSGRSQNQDSGPGVRNRDTSSTRSGSDVETNSKSAFWDELENGLNAIVGDGPERSVILNRQAGLVVVRAMPEELREVGDYLVQLRSALYRQVILEAKILEVVLDDGFQSGINWSLIGNDGSAGHVGGSTLFDTDSARIRSDLLGQSIGLDGGVPGVDFSTSAFGGTFALALNVGDFSAFIELLQTQGDVRVLSSPRVSTVNNQKAVIKVGSDEYFITDVDVDRDENGTTTTFEVNPFFSGIALDVTPSIDEGGGVVLHIHPSITEVSDQTKSFIVNGEDQQLPLAFTQVRESDSIVRARSGQVVVLGGLMQELSRATQAATPGLGEVPVLGSLFRHDRQSATRTELVILLRPLVVDDAGWADEVRQARGRFLSLENEADGRIRSGLGLPSSE
ncbi:MAG: pilus (MSHA type) biogenesis protein MshL [Gammaproteobacteria bacterium]|nr:pilus (MSHA type) biogenesis protein MshL [Gammaproteobacteria bacterium]